jgi:hypothetical protein
MGGLRGVKDVLHLYAKRCMNDYELNMTPEEAYELSI